jgi:hypothetical protein
LILTLADFVKLWKSYGKRRVVSGDMNTLLSDVERENPRDLSKLSSRPLPLIKDPFPFVAQYACRHGV